MEEYERSGKASTLYKELKITFYIKPVRMVLLLIEFFVNILNQHKFGLRNWLVEMLGKLERNCP